ncbi:MAG: AraC family transcriptional regulator [Firmicutes bacterium]|nr:AraC family transcriptional regulator [Bacillota bacterium]
MQFVPTTLNSVIKVDKVVTIHYFEYARDFIFSGEKHDFWELVYIDTGEVGVMADGKGLTLRQGEAIFHKPLEYHNIWARGKFANVIIISFVSSSRAMKLFHDKMITFDANDRELLSKIIKEAGSLFCEPLNIVDLEKMTKKKNAPFGSEQLIRLHLEELLINIARKGSVLSKTERSSPKEAEMGRQKIVDAIIDFLNKHLSDQLTLDDVCAQLCFSKTYVKSLFREKMGMGVIQYYISLKIDLARRLISEGGMTFSEIASKCGFSSIHYFSKTFKKHTNMTPTEYSQSVKAKGIL